MTARVPDPKSPTSLSSLVPVASELPSPMSLLDEWIAEVGEQEVAATMRAAADEVSNGTARDLIDKDAYAAYMTGHQRSAP